MRLCFYRLNHLKRMDSVFKINMSFDASRKSLCFCLSSCQFTASLGAPLTTLLAHLWRFEKSVQYFTSFLSVENKEIPYER